MPKDEIQCDRCQQVQHFSAYSKNQRKEDDPMCLRCVAWGETQHHGVVPAPLATGHVSVEEHKGEVWAGRNYMTDEAYYSTPQAPVSGRDAIGLEGSGDVTDADLQKITKRTAGLAMSETQSVASVSTTKASIPPHLRSRVTPAPSSSAGDASSSAGPTLPPHLRRRAPGGGSSSGASVSTATTVREAREENKEKRAVEFNAWDEKGNKIVRKTVPSTIASTASTTSSRQVSSNFPRGATQNRPARQIDVNPEPPAGVEVEKKNYPKAKPVGGDPYLKEWPEPTW